MSFNTSGCYDLQSQFFSEINPEASGLRLLPEVK
jgi:hypothetical protein